MYGRNVDSHSVINKCLFSLYLSVFAMIKNARKFYQACTVFWGTVHRFGGFSFVFVFKLTSQTDRVEKLLVWRIYQATITAVSLPCGLTLTPALPRAHLFFTFFSFSFTHKRFSHCSWNNSVSRGSAQPLPERLGPRTPRLLWLLVQECIPLFQSLGT